MLWSLHLISLMLEIYKLCQDVWNKKMQLVRAVVKNKLVSKSLFRHYLAIDTFKAAIIYIFILLCFGTVTIYACPLFLILQ